MENVADKVTKGRARGNRTHGESRGNAKLTVNDVREIREALDSQEKIARRFGISRIQVRRIRSGQSWKGAAEYDHVV